MSDKSWSDLQEEDFKSPGVSAGVRAAIKQIRKATKVFVDDTTTSEAFYFCADDVFGEAVWKEVVKIIVEHGGPEPPAKVTLSEGSNDEVPLNWETLGQILNHQGLPPDLLIMLTVIAKCFHDRINTIRNRVCAKPSDWWLRLALADVDSSAGPILPEDGVDEEDN